MTGLEEQLRGLQRQFSGRSLEMLSAWGLIATGLTFLLPGDSFSRGWYSHMAPLASEEVWGFGMTVVGVAQLAAVRWCRTFRRYWCRMIGCALACSLWSYMGWPIFCRYPPAAGAVPYLLLAISQALVVAKGRPV